MAAGVFLVALLVYLATGPTAPESHDAVPSAYIPVSLLGDGDLAFSPSEAPIMFLWRDPAARQPVAIEVPSWRQVPEGSGESFGARRMQGGLVLLGPRYYLTQTVRTSSVNGEPLFASIFGPAAGLTALPVAAAAGALGANLQEDHWSVARVAKWTAALLAAGSAAMVYLTAAALTTPRRALLVAAVYALGSCIWMISSRSLWQQTPELFFLSLGTLCLVRGESAWLRGAAAGLAFAAAAACRPTAMLPALAGAGYLALSDRRCLAAFVAAAVPIALGVLAYNQYYFGSLLDFGQVKVGAPLAVLKTGSPELWQTPLWVGAAGLLASPSRGLLVYSPFFAAAFAGAVIAWRDPQYARLRFLTVAVPALWLPAFAWFDWWGGWTYGYRPIVDSVPLLAVLCVPAIDRAVGRPAWRLALAAAAGWSIFVQVIGVAGYHPADWNARVSSPGAAPADIDRPEHRARLWSLRDSQIGYLIALLAGQRQR
jgi:hypothetical protein